MRLVILYGSETGTAQDVAEQIWRESKKFGFDGPVLPIDEYPLDQLIEGRFIVFVASTTGNGDEPTNMRKTWKRLLRRNLPNDLLNHLNFACLGLGDSSYVKFNYAAKKLHKRLLQLGANAIIPLGLGDDQHDHGMAAVALPWIQELWQHLEMDFGKTCKAINNEIVFKWRVETLETNSCVASPKSLASSFYEKSDGSLIEGTHYFTLKHNQRVTSENHFQDVRLLQFDCDKNVKWHAGDVLQVRPCNSDGMVQEFFELVAEHGLNFTADTVVQLKSNYSDMPLPRYLEQPVSIGLVAKYIWDFNARPRQRFFELLAGQCLDEMEKEKLEEFSRSEGLDELISYVNRPRRNILEVLQDFRFATSKLTLPVLFELMTTIQERSFSISSMPSNGTLDLLVAVVEYKTKLVAPRLGLCSNWLKTMKNDSVVIGCLKPGTMLLPKDLEAPIIMVGPGTGVAPFRSIVQWREEQTADKLNGIGTLVLFFGCRSQWKDFHFSADIKKWQVKDWMHVFCAFSRDQEHKVYVQHLIKKEKLLLRKLIEKQNAVILVAGSSNNMPKEVKEAFAYVMDGNEDYIDQMVKQKRYQEETWS